MTEYNLNSTTNKINNDNNNNKEELYKVTNNGVVASPKLKFLKFISRYPEIETRLKSRPLHGNDIELIKYVVNLLNTKYNGNDIKRPIIFTHTGDSWHLIMIALLIYGKRLITCTTLNAYELINIYLDKNEDYQSINQINTDLSFIYLGYSEFDNKRQSDIIVQLFDGNLSKGKNTILTYKTVSKEPLQSLKLLYPLVYDYIINNKIDVISINEDVIRGEIKECINGDSSISNNIPNADRLSTVINEVITLNKDNNVITKGNNEELGIW